MYYNSYELYNLTVSFLPKNSIKIMFIFILCFILVIILSSKPDNISIFDNLLVMIVKHPIPN